MKRLSLALAITLLIPMPVSATEEVQVVRLMITEIKVRNDSSGLNEFIEIYNPGDTDVSLNGYNLEYFNSAIVAVGQVPIKAVINESLLAAKARLVLAKDPTQIPDSIASPFTSLFDSAGVVRLTDAEGVVIDQVAWSSSATQAIIPINHVPTTSSTKSLLRSVDEASEPIYNPAVWELATPSPVSSVLTIPPPLEEENPPDNPNEVEEEPIPQEEIELPDSEIITDEEPVLSLLPLIISELLPNPKSPETDNLDEYVELFNPNPEPIDLSGYKIQTGSKFSYTYIFSEGTIPANGYYLVTSGASNLSLANTNGRARLISPTGTILTETVGYEDAKEGDAWSFIAGVWQWTTTPTPMASNLLTLPVVEIKPVKTAKTVTKTVKPKKVASPKVKAASTKKATAPKTSKKSDTVAAVAPQDVDPPPPLHPTVLAGVSGLAVLYAGYEYRHDMANRIYQLRSYRAARRAARTASSGR